LAELSADRATLDRVLRQILSRPPGPNSGEAVGMIAGHKRAIFSQWRVGDMCLAQHSELMQRVWLWLVSWDNVWQRVKPTV
jgi:hypothetical protein